LGVKEVFVQLVRLSQNLKVDLQETKRNIMGI